MTKPFTPEQWARLPRKWRRRINRLTGVPREIAILHAQWWLS